MPKPVKKRHAAIATTWEEKTVIPELGQSLSENLFDRGVEEAPTGWVPRLRLAGLMEFLSLPQMSSHSSTGGKSRLVFLHAFFFKNISF